MSQGPVIATWHASSSPGGLAAYRRGLASEFKKRTGLSVFECAATGELPPGGSSALLGGIGHWTWRAWMSLATHPRLHPLLAFWVRAKFLPPAAAHLPPNPSAVHFVGTGWEFLGFAMSSYAKKCGVPFTVWPAVHPGQWGDDRIDLRLYRLADRVFCQSRHEAEHLVARGLDPAKTLLCGLPPMCQSGGDGGRLRHLLGIGDRPSVLFLGRRSAGKGFAALGQAWKLVLGQVPDAVLLVAGPDGDTPLALAGEPSLRDLGVPNESTKADALAACDVLALPSAYESFGIVFVEAWSYGRPVICGPAPASRELVRDGETGLWADQTPESIAATTIRLLASPDLRRRLGQAGRKFQQEHLTWQKTLDTHLHAWSATD